MSNYRRLISYIYAYEGEVKGKNMGFARIETRGSQCKITVSVKRVYVGSNEIGVYLLSGDQEIYLGNIFVRGGVGEFRAVVSANDVENSGISVDQCFGLTIHDIKDTWYSYTTIWEDAVTHVAEVELRKEPLECKKETRGGISEEQIQKAVREIAQEFPLETVEFASEASEISHEDTTNIEPAETVVNVESTDDTEVTDDTETIETTGSIEARELIETISPPLSERAGFDQILAEENREESSHEMVWDKMRREHTKILAFDYEEGCEILTIKPQDIGLLPRDIWVYGNNSFLLHGYYNYRYLILAKLFHSKGAPRYLLGVPGHYYNNERYMASMFGFPNFVLSKEQTTEDGRFGFWYTDVNIGSRL